MFGKYKIEIKWAVIFIALSLLWMVLEKLSGLHSTYINYHLYLTNLFAIPAILVYVLALKDKKKSYHSGEMTYLQGLVSGIIITVIIALVSPLTQWVTSYVITPEYFPNVIEHAVGMGHYPNTEAAEAHFNYRNFAVQSVIGALIMGLVTTAIVMIFIRSKRSEK
ncbi:MAG: DUF4199 domain-containing protein [Bacteroidota bacterium]